MASKGIIIGNTSDWTQQITANLTSVVCHQTIVWSGITLIYYLNKLLHWPLQNVLTEFNLSQINVEKGVVSDTFGFSNIPTYYCIPVT